MGKTWKSRDPSTPSSGLQSPPILLVHSAHRRVTRERTRISEPNFSRDDDDRRTRSERKTRFPCNLSRAITRELGWKPFVSDPPRSRAREIENRAPAKLCGYEEQNLISMHPLDCRKFAEPSSLGGLVGTKDASKDNVDQPPTRHSRDTPDFSTTASRKPLRPRRGYCC